MAKGDMLVADPVRFRITETFTTALLGTAPANKAIYAEYIATRRAEGLAKRAAAAQRMGIGVPAPVGTVEEELETIVSEEQGLTVFHADATGIFLFDYEVVGHYKEAAETLADAHGVPMVRSKLDTLMYVRPCKPSSPGDRRIYICDSAGVPCKRADGRIERPLRAMTMQGPRVSLTCSEMVTEGRTVQYHLEMLPYLRAGWGKSAKAVEIEPFIRLLCSISDKHGRGQWRSGGNGRFTAVIEKL